MASTIADHRRVLRDRVPLIDLRAPAEFATGAFPNAVNLPLLTDAERAAVGTRYRTCGQQAAIELGESLVAGDVRDARIDAWRRYTEAHPGALLYCWRGGLRSRIAQDWLRQCGRDVPRISGGYKALRRACLDATLEFCASPRTLVLGGRTGSGKTELLREFAASIDLEALANHRGSAFGANATPQPTPIAFENALAIELLWHMHRTAVLVEDESRTIGRLALPEALHTALQSAPVVILEIERDARAARIYREYVEAPLASGVEPHTLECRFRAAVDRIARRLGGLRHARVRAAIEAAFSRGGDGEAHVEWIGLLLDGYYDPMYDHQLTKKLDRVVARGGVAEVRGHLRAALARDQ